ncbi:MAG: dioxygenase [Chloroflexi bacterium]|nr:MAG: dioxygenase [Chloroflexota bacterium]
MRRFCVMAMLLFLAACGGQASPRPVATSSPATASATSEASGQCSGQPTPAQTEGPYFKPGSPMRTSLVEPGMAGTRLALSGRVLSRDCRPIAGARLDFWQADASGSYDNAGYRLRGNQTSESDGRYALDTVVPGEYPGRTEHIHVKVQPAGGGTLTTQLYFPGVSRNQQDSIFDPRLLLTVKTSPSGLTAIYDFVLNG